MRRTGGSFIGREREIARLLSLVGSARLVTIWGPGGIGKTRLVQQVARQSGWNLLGVELADSKGREGLLEAVALALEVSLGATSRDSEVAVRIEKSLASRPSPMLLLDGFEHLVEDTAELIEGWIRACPRLTVIITSRERLRSSEESTLELGPMGTSDDGTCDASKLLLARVEESSGRSLTLPHQAQLAILVRELEGIPLAIELAAARFEVLGVEGLIERLPDKLRLLTRGTRGRPTRHATMRAAIAWSWDLLQNEERTALMAISMFRGGFTADAAEAVLEQLPFEDRLAAIEALRDKSLVTIREGDPGEPPRFALFDTVREFAMEKLLEGSDAAVVLARHDGFYLRSGSEWARRIERSGDLRATLLLRRELPNLLEVFERSLSGGGASDAIAAADALLAVDAVLATSVPSQSRMTLWQRARAALSKRVDDARWSRVLAAHGRSALAVGDSETALASLSSAIACLGADPATDARLALPDMLLDLGIVHHTRQEIAQARDAYRRALDAAGELGLERSQARALGNLGTLLHDARELESARLHYGRSMAKAAALGDVRIEGIMLANLALIDQEEGHWEHARRAYERAVDLLEQARDRRLRSITLANLAMLEAETSGAERAILRLTQVIEEQMAIGDGRSEALARLRLSVIQLLRGNVAEGHAELALAKVMFARLADTTGLEVLALSEDLCSSDLGVAHAAMRSARAAGANGHSLVERSDDARAIVRLFASTTRGSTQSQLLIGAGLAAR